MKSSYTHLVNFGDVIESITFALRPKRIVEFGILEGFSLKAFADAAPTAKINAFDIFEEFNGNHCQRSVSEKFISIPQVKIEYGDFYQLYTQLEDHSIDIIHVDIANDGHVFQFAVDHYMSKLTSKGILVLEGGSESRDRVPWMEKFHKKPIRAFLQECSFPFRVIGDFPSFTIIHPTIPGVATSN